MHERLFVQIWHQRRLYPATFVAVPGLCEAVRRTPEQKHADLLNMLAVIEQSPRDRKQNCVPWGQSGLGEVPSDFPDNLSVNTEHMGR